MISSLNPLAQRLLDWFAVNGRDLPWRVKNKAHDDPYAVWISEIMLQQTTVKTVRDYFIRWMKRFPNLKTLAAADLQDVLLMWQGLGYYTRAKKIHECARLVMSQYNGQFPKTREELLKLPGIGPYTASSICCFSYNAPETVVDGNVIRVIARLYGLTHAINHDEIYKLAQKLTPIAYGADYASAIMDLGATVCTPTAPDCLLCPWRTTCVACQKGLTDQIPLIQKPKKQEKSGFVYLITDTNGRYYIRKRTEKGLLSGLYEFPWHYDTQTPFQIPWIPDKTNVSHTFTHFKLTLGIRRAASDTVIFTNGLFVHPNDFDKYPFSTLMKKVMKYLSPRQGS